MHSKPHIHVDNNLSRNMSSRLRIDKVLLFNFRRDLRKRLYVLLRLPHTSRFFVGGKSGYNLSEHQLSVHQPIFCRD